MIEGVAQTKRQQRLQDKASSGLSIEVHLGKNVPREVQYEASQTECVCESPAPLQKNLTPFPSSMVMISALPSVCNACSERSSIQSSNPWNSSPSVSSPLDNS